VEPEQGGEDEAHALLAARPTLVGHYGRTEVQLCGRTVCFRRDHEPGPCATSDIAHQQLVRFSALYPPGREVLEFSLLLPQEITGLGKDCELVVVEDCPPILATKIRYYADRTFVDRLKSVSPGLRALRRKLPSERDLKQAVKAGELAAPVPRIDLDAHQALVLHACPIQMASTTVPVGGRIVERSVTAADVPDLHKLPLSSFVVDFSNVPVPSDGTLDVPSLHAYADELCRRAGIKS
jgi:hypothetical protein